MDNGRTRSSGREDADELKDDGRCCSSLKPVAIAKQKNKKKNIKNLVF